MEFKNVKWKLGGMSGRMITTNQYGGFVADVDTKQNALLISKSPEMLEELQDTIDDLKILKANILDASKTNNRWEGMANVIQNWIDRKQELVKSATELEV